MWVVRLYTLYIKNTGKGQKEMDSYIVRIYGWEERAYWVAAGLMETAGMGKERFRVPWELWKMHCFKKGRKSVKIGP
jgi:hypothetical protein